MFFVLSPDSFRKGGNHQYHTVVKDAAGIVVKTQVKTNGVVVGHVERIELQISDTRIDIEVDDQVKIPAGSKITIKEKGLLGDVFLEILRVDDSGKYLQSGDFIAPDESQTSISALIGIGGSIAKDIKRITHALSTAIGGDEGADSIVAIVEDLRSFMADAKDIVQANKDDIRHMVADLRKTTELLRHAVGDEGSRFNEIVGNLHTASTSLREIVSGENRQKIDRIIASFDTTMENVEATAKDVRLVTAKIEKGEGTLGRLISDDDALTNFEEALKEVRTVLTPATKLKVAVDYHGEMRADKTTQHYFNMQFRTRPDKFYLLGMTDVDKHIREIKKETFNVADSDIDPDATDSTQITETISERKNILFNAQFAKRWHVAQMRFGFFESSGGIASDFIFFRDRVQLTLEAFDWSSTSVLRDTAHFKGYLQGSFADHFYLLAGVDDPTRKAPTGSARASPNYFFGAGLSFSDQDLKAVFGTAALAL